MTQNTRMRPPPWRLRSSRVFGKFPRPEGQDSQLTAIPFFGSVIGPLIDSEGTLIELKNYSELIGSWKDGQMIEDETSWLIKWVDV